MHDCVWNSGFYVSVQAQTLLAVIKTTCCYVMEDASSLSSTSCLEIWLLNNASAKNKLIRFRDSTCLGSVSCGSRKFLSFNKDIISYHTVTLLNIHTACLRSFAHLRIVGGQRWLTRSVKDNHRIVSAVCFVPIWRVILRLIALD